MMVNRTRLIDLLFYYLWGMEYQNDNMDEYISAHTTPESDVLYELNRQTHLKSVNPRMLSGHLQGRILSMISKIIQPQRILEIGTFTGYSALCLAEGLKKGGQLITIDKNYELESLVKEYVLKSDYSEQIEMKIGEAMDILPKLNKDFDLVFIDADKPNYLNYYNAIIEELPQGAVIIADNVLWSGKILEETQKNDVSTAVLKLFNDTIQKDERVENVLFPIRDGLMVIRKK